MQSAISPSPVHLAFSHIQWNAPITVSRPEQSLLQSAEENPLEYTLAEYGDAFAYARLLLKALDQMTGPSNPGSVSQLELEQAALSEEEALQYYMEDKTGVVTHYLITKLYEMIGLLLENQRRSQTKSTTSSSKIVMATLFYQHDQLLDDWRPLLRLLYRPGDPFSQRGAALCLAYILQAGCLSPSTTVNKAGHPQPIPMVEETLQSLVSWLTSRLQSSHSTSLGVVTPTLVVLASCPPARIIFDNAGGIGYLARHLRQFRKLSSMVPQANQPIAYRRSSSVTSTGSVASKANLRRKAVSSSVQQLYELCFCLWTMTYECHSNDSIRQHFHRDGAVAALSDLLASAPREKIARLALAALTNLAQSDNAFVQEMIGCGVLKSVDLLRDRQWTDPDVLDDLETIHRILQHNFKELTRWEVYQAELETGKLQWGILHTEKFFRENARRMEGPNGDFIHVKRLVKLIASAHALQQEDDDVLAIACFDLGEFVRHYPNGRAIAKRLGAKAVVMQCMDHEDAQVQRHAMQCVSKMLIHNWQAVGGL